MTNSLGPISTGQENLAEVVSVEDGTIARWAADTTHRAKHAQDLARIAGLWALGDFECPAACAGTQHERTCPRNPQRRRRGRKT